MGRLAVDMLGIGPCSGSACGAASPAPHGRSPHSEAPGGPSPGSHRTFNQLLALFARCDPGHCVYTYTLLSS